MEPWVNDTLTIIVTVATALGGWVAYKQLFKNFQVLGRFIRDGAARLEGGFVTVVLTNAGDFNALVDNVDWNYVNKPGEGAVTVNPPICEQLPLKLPPGDVEKIEIKGLPSKSQLPLRELVVTIHGADNSPHFMVIHLLKERGKFTTPLVSVKPRWWPWSNREIITGR